LVKKIFDKIVKDQNNKEVFLKSALFLFFRIGGFLFGYLFTVLITQNYGKQVFGFVTLGFTVFMIFSVVSKFGFDINFTRVVSSNRYSNEQIKKLYFKILGITFACSLCVSFIFIFFREWISIQVFNKPDFSDYLYWAALALPCWVVVFINAGVFRGFKNNALFSFFNSFGRFGLASIILLIYIFFSTDYSNVSPLIIHFIAVLILALLSTIINIKTFSKYVNDKSEVISTKSFFKSSLPILISSSVFILLTWIDKLFLGVYETESEIALFEVSAKIALVIGFTLEALNSILAPKISELFYKKDVFALQNTINFTSKINISISIFMFLLILSFPTQILSIFGESFKEGKTILLILATGKLISSLSGSVGIILQMTGNQQIYKRIMIMALFINLTLNLILIEPYGVIGVAIATSLTMIIWNLSAVIIIKKKLKINSFYYPLNIKNAN